MGKTKLTVKNNTVKAPDLNMGKNKNNSFINAMYEKGVLYFFLSFIIPFIIMLIAFHKQGIHMLWFTDGKFQETGSEQFLVVDLWHQYYPFFRVLREKLLTGGSMLYSWQNGIGTNFLALIAYYAASPLNLLSVFFDEAHTREALMYFLAAKIGLCGAFFSCFLRYTFGRKDLSIVGFSLMYALCSYMMGYYWNVMWFDTIAIFPLVMLGVVAMCREGKWKLYTVTLALSLITNYYVGFFICIFTIFMFAFSAIIEWQGFKKFFHRIWLVIRSSVIGICLGGVILLPAYKALQLTYGVNNQFPKTIKWEYKWQEIFGNLLSYNAPTTKEGLPNLACGMLAVILMGVFLFSAGIKMREKIAAVFMLALIAVSCNWNQLNFIWHGFHTTNQLPYRYAFIFSFVLVTAAYRAYDVMTEKGIKLYQIPMMLLAPAGVFYMYYLVEKASDEGFSVKDSVFVSSLMISGAYILIFICMKIIPVKDKKIFKGLINIITTAAIVIEMSGNAFIGVDSVGTSDYASYPSYNTEVQNILSQMREREESPFYRTEMTSTYTLNDSALYGYNGLSQFSSSANVDVTKFYMRMGMYGSEAGNRFYYRTATPVVNSILGVKYIVSKLGPLNSCSAFLEPVASDGSVNLYENKYPLSLGFMVDDDVYALSSNAVNIFEYQNNLMKKITGSSKDLFTAQPVYMISNDNVITDKESYGEYFYTIEDRDRSASVTYQFEGVENGYLYGYLKGRKVANIDVYQGDMKIESGISSKGYSIAFPMGDGQKGDIVSVTLNFEDDADFGNYTLVSYAINEEAFTEMYDILADEQFEITEFSDAEIKGNINAQNSGVLYFSIPYEKGWSVYVDGKKTETVAVAEAMLGVNVSAGQHEIKLKYIPEGFTVGLMATGGAVLLFILFAFIDSRRKKKTDTTNITEFPIRNKKMEDISAVGAVNDLGFTAAVSVDEESSDIIENTENTEENNEKSESPDSVQGD